MTIKLRSEVAWFAEQMEIALRRKDEEYNGNSWKDSEIDSAIIWLENHLEKLKYRRKVNLGEQQTIYDAADIGNFAMMIADLARIKQEKK